MATLTVKQQIYVLEHINWFQMETWRYGLCSSIRHNIENCLNISLEDYNGCLKDFIPIFTIENARKFGLVRTEGFWWSLTEEGYKCRKEFVNWMITTLKK